VASGIGFFLWNKGATQSNPGTLAAFNNAVVPLAVICSLRIFGEIKNIQEGDLLKLTTGAILIFGAVMIAQISSKVKN
jgi:drug/metabolite transporter (DMT)-like permease